MAMLYLLHGADRNGDAPTRVPITEPSAIQLEQALLAADDATRIELLKSVLTRDSAVAHWVRKRAALDCGRDFDAIDAAATWWSACLVPSLAAALLTNQDEAGSATGLSWRLPALVARLHEFDRRLELEKIESLKELAYGASHEINNPLANIAARAQTLLDGEADPERQRKLMAIYRQAMRAHEMISDLMLFARPPKLQLAPCDLRLLVERVIGEHRAAATGREIQLSCHAGDEPIELPADETQLAVAVGAVVTNAVEAIGANGHVLVNVRQAILAGVKWAEVVVRDDGPGITAEVRQHMFDPFYSGREAGRGLGFGLAKCWRIVTDHGGQMVVNQPTGRGAEIAIRLPIDANS